MAEHRPKKLWDEAVPVSLALGAAEGEYFREMPSDPTGFGALQSEYAVLDFPGMINCMPRKPPHKEAW